MPTTVPTWVPGRSLDPLKRAWAHADAVRENAPGCHQPIVVHRRWRHTRTGRRGQRRRPARIPTPCSPRFPVNDRAPGTALGFYLAGNRPGSASTRLMTAGCPATSRVRPAFNPTVGGVTGTSPRYGNRNRRRTSRPDLRAHPRGPRQGQGLGPQARAPERLVGRLTARRQGGGDPSLPRTGRVQGPRRQDHRRLPADPLQLHEHRRAQAESFLRSAPFGALRVTESSSLRTVN